MMVELAAKDVRRLGLAPTHKQTYKTVEQRRTARAKLFQSMDSSKSGSISFDDWLQYSLKHIAGKVALAEPGNNATMYGSKTDFMNFAVALTKSRESAEYKEFYRFLWQCFEDADQDRDGQVNLQEFDQMVEKAGAFPRSHGLAPLTSELFRTTEARVAGRKKHFDAMNKSRSGKICFEEWLEFTYAHVCDKVRGLATHEEGAYGFDQRSDEVASFESMGRAQFIAFARLAVTDRSSPEFEQLYQFLLECFTAADNDYDGKVDAEEFDMMVELAAKDVRRLGLAPTHKQTYKSVAERRAARLKLFQAMDADNSGTIGFEEWLQYSLKHIAGKVANARLSDPASMYGDKAEFLRFSVALTKSRESAEFKEFYRFLAQCFEESDQDRDGKVNLQEFDQMVEKAGAFPRAHGLAPLTGDIFPTAAARVQGRRRHFEAMAAGQGSVSFEQWLEFTYTHVCAKVRGLGEATVPTPRMRPSSMSRSEFLAFCRRATSDKFSQEHETLYQFLLQCFTVADSDYDGKVDAE